MGKKKKSYALLEGKQVVIFLVACVLLFIILMVVFLQTKKIYTFEEQASLRVKEISWALALYKADFGAFPPNDLGLNALTTEPKDGSAKGPYLTARMLVDSWGRQFVYSFPGVHNPGSFDIYSLGVDGRPGSDDIGNWTE